MKKITIYSTPNCHFCHAAKEFLMAHHIEFHDIDVAADMASRAEMIEMTGQMGVPVIKVEDESSNGAEPVVMVGFSEKLLADAVGIAA